MRSNMRMMVTVLASLALLATPSGKTSLGAQQVTVLAHDNTPLRALRVPKSQGNAEVLAKPARVEVSNIALSDALEALLDASGVSILFSPALIPDVSVSCECADRSVGEALDVLLHDTGLNVLVQRDQIFIARAAAQQQSTVPDVQRSLDLSSFQVAPVRPLLPLRVDARDLPAVRQQVVGTITGRVTDAESGQPVAAGQVYIGDLDLGALSQQNGSYLLLNVPAGTHTVSVEVIGYRSASREVTVASGATVVENFEIEPQALALDELVVTGTAGAARRREVGNTVAQLNTADVTEPVQNTETLLQGRVPGLQIAQSGAQAGSGSRIRLRGNVSASLSNQPIIYIDGVRARSDFYPNINPEHLSGRQYSSFQAPSPLNDLNPQDIERVEIVRGPAATTLYGAEAASGVIQIFTKRGQAGSPVWQLQIDQGFSRANPHGPRETLRGTPIEDFDFRSPGGGNEPEGGTARYQFLEPWLQLGHRQRYNLSVRGGTDAVRYSVSGVLEDNETPVVTEWEDKKGIRANVGITLSPTLNLDVNTSYNQTEWYTPGGGNYLWGLFLAAARGERNYWGSNEYDVLNRSVTEHHFLQRIDRFLLGGTLTHTTLPNWTNRLTVGYDYSNYDGVINVDFGSLADPEGYRQKTQTRPTLLTADFVSSYELNLESDLRTKLSVGGQSITREEKEQRGWAYGFSGPGEVTLSNAGITTARENAQRVITGGLFGEALFDFRDRYFLTVGARVDGSSAFGGDFGWAVYPKASVSYIISDEPFWSEAMGQLKLRAAYGHAGRAPGAFDAERVWNPVSWGGRVAYDPDVPGNPDLGPERTAELEVGFDGTWLDERLTVSFTYYRQTTTDALISVPLPDSEGPWSSQLENVGKIRNSGIEAQIDGRILERGDFSWDLGVDLSTNNSEALDLGPVEQISTNGRNRIRVGYPVPTTQGTLILNPSEIADPVVETNHFFGPNHPTLIVSPRTTVRLPWGGVSVTARGEYQGGHYMISSADRWAHITGALTPHCWDAHPLIDAGQASQLTARERAWCQRETLESVSFVYPADFFKLREVSVQIPLTWAVERLGGATTASLTLSGHNLWRWLNDDFRAWDPENGGWEGNSGTGSDVYEHMAPPQIYTAAIRVAF